MFTISTLYTPAAPVGLLSPVMVSLTDGTDEDDALIIIELLLFAYDTMTQSSTVHLYVFQGTSTHRSYTIRKSKTLEVMISHENEVVVANLLWLDNSTGINRALCLSYRVQVAKPSTFLMMVLPSP